MRRRIAQFLVAALLFGVLGGQVQAMSTSDSVPEDISQEPVTGRDLLDKALQHELDTLKRFVELDKQSEPEVQGDQKGLSQEQIALLGTAPS